MRQTIDWWISWGLDELLWNLSCKNIQIWIKNGLNFIVVWFGCSMACHGKYFFLLSWKAYQVDSSHFNIWDYHVSSCSKLLLTYVVQIKWISGGQVLESHSRISQYSST